MLGLAPRLIPSVLLVCVVFACAACTATHERKRLARPLEHRYSVRDPAFQRELGVLLGPPLVGGNRAVALVHGDAFYPAMLKAIRSAQRSITFETYIFRGDEVGRQFADALAERARAGVKVHAIFDTVGMRGTSPAVLARMREAGVEFERYQPFTLLRPGRFNNRTHRKLLIIDGRIGFTGGAGIAGLWAGDVPPPRKLRDIHYRVEGPVVAQMQAAFLDNWLKTRGVLLHGPDFFPPLPARGSLTAQAFAHSPLAGGINMDLMYQLAIAASTKSVKMITPYFVPDRNLTHVLRSAARRGVDVEIIIPGRHSAAFFRHANRTHWPALLDAGVKFFEYGPSKLHAKLLVVDGLFVSVGSANADIRSLRLNEEANLNVLDAGFAAEQTAIFERDKRASQPAELQWKRRRGPLDTAARAAAALLRNQL